MTHENNNTPNPLTPEDLDLSIPVLLEPYAVTYDLFPDVDTKTIQGLVAFESRNYARWLPEGNLPGSGRVDTDTVLPFFDNIDLVSRRKIEYDLELLRKKRAIANQPKPGLFNRLAEAGKTKGALTSVMVVAGIGGLLLGAWNYGDNGPRQYMRDHPNAIQTP